MHGITIEQAAVGWWVYRFDGRRSWRPTQFLARRFAERLGRKEEHD